MGDLLNSSDATAMKDILSRIIIDQIIGIIDQCNSHGRPQDIRKCVVAFRDALIRSDSKRAEQKP